MADFNIGDNISQISQTQRTGDQSEITSRKQKIKDDFIMMKTDPIDIKGVTKQDTEMALNELHPQKAVGILLSKSPVGETVPSSKNLMDNGYITAYHVNPDGSHDWVGGNGAINILDKDGTTTVKYKTENYEQNFVYDNDGKLKNGTMVIRDKFGNVEKKYIIWIDENGKRAVID